MTRCRDERPVPTAVLSAADSNCRRASWHRERRALGHAQEDYANEVVADNRHELARTRAPAALARRRSRRRKSAITLQSGDAFDVSKHRLGVRSIASHTICDGAGRTFPLDAVAFDLEAKTWLSRPQSITNKVRIPGLLPHKNVQPKRAQILNPEA